MKGQLVTCIGRACSVLGHLEKAEFENDMSLEFPSINVNDYYKLHDYLQRSDRQPVIVHIRNTGFLSFVFPLNVFQIIIHG